MSEFDPRAYMNAQSEAEDSKSGFEFDILTVSALGVMALAGGLFGYNTLMDVRQKSQTKLNQMMVEGEAISEARKAQRRDQVGGISLAANYANGMMQSQKMANGVMNQLERSQRLKNVDLPKGDISDAKAFLSFPKNNAGEYAKYMATQGMIKRCNSGGSYKDRLQNYRQKNASQIEGIKASYGPVEPLRVNRNGTPESMKHIKTEKDAMKFVLSGGANRHMSQSMGAMAAMSGQPGVSGELMMQVAAIGNAKIKTRRDYRGWSGEACNYLNNVMASGRLDVKLRKA